MKYKKTAEATRDFIGNKIANKITGVSRNSQQNNSETVTNEHDKEIRKGRYISLEERQKTIDNLRLRWYIKMLYNITRVPKNSRQNNSETLKNEHDKEIRKERYMSPEGRQKIMDNLISNIMYNNEIPKYTKFVRQYAKSTIYI